MVKLETKAQKLLCLGGERAGSKNNMIMKRNYRVSEVLSIFFDLSGSNTSSSITVMYVLYIFVCVYYNKMSQKCP